jgi:ribosomal protein L20
MSRSTIGLKIPRITIDFKILCEIFPEATNLNSLPRKKKKALKKKILRGLIDIALVEAELYVFNASYGDLIEELKTASLEFEKLSNTKDEESNLH